MTPDRYTVHYLGPGTTITEDLNGPWPRWESARAACIEHLDRQVAKCEKTLMCLRRSGSFFEYQMLVEEMAEMEAGDVAQVAEGGTLA